MTVTYHGQNEAELLRSRDAEVSHLRIMLANANETIVLFAIPSGRILEVNHFGLLQLGYGQARIREMSVDDICPWFSTAEARMLLSGAARGVPEVGETVMTRLIRADGQGVPVEITVRLHANTPGRCAVIVARDIRDRLNADSALRESETRYMTIIENAEDAIFIKDRELRYSMINPALARIFDLSADEIIGKTDQGLFGKQLDPHIQQVDERVLAGEVVEEERTTPVAGQQRTLHVIEVPMRNDVGDVLGICGIARDVTDQRRLEMQLRQAQKLEALGTMAGGIAHDFNNILAAIMGYTELALEDAEEDSEQQVNLKEVLLAGKRASELVKQMLTFSRRGEQKQKPIQIGLIVKEALKLMRSSLPATIRIRQEFDDNLPYVMADPSQIHQLIVNLCTNAGQAMEARGGDLEVQIQTITIDGNHLCETNGSPINNGFAFRFREHCTLTPGDYLRLTVKDSGCGMTPEMMKSAFDPYFTTREKGEGTGMGLAVVLGIAKGCRGGIMISSEPGVGTEVELYLKSHSQRKPGTSSTKAKLPLGSGRILFVDDEPTLAELARQMLERLGYEVYYETDSLQALARFKSDPYRYDLVITDMTMPGMTGEKLAEVLVRIREDIPIILCTGYNRESTPEPGSVEGIRATLLKPIALQDLAITVRKVLLSERGLPGAID